jgi:hypothetical protein
MRDLCILQHLYSKVFLISQRQERDITECVGDGLMSPSSGFDVLSDTSVICVYLHNCCHSQPTVHIQGAAVYVNVAAVSFIMMEADSLRNIRYHFCFPMTVHLKRLHDVDFSLISQSVAKFSITCSVQLYTFLL